MSDLTINRVKLSDRWYSASGPHPRSIRRWVVWRNVARQGIIDAIPIRRTLTRRGACLVSERLNGAKA